MADRRMLTKKVTDDDNFMALSASAQALYLHLSMAADDDGFCNQVSVSMFKAHASVQDLQALLEKRYIYQFENGVIVIKHWRMANALRKDRYTPTAFQDELAKLDIKDNGAYTWLPNGCQSVANRLPQDSIDKESIDKDSIRESVRPQKRFVAPTVEEVDQYCRERNNNIDAQHFVDYYDVRDWYAGNRRMKDWKAAVRTWERNGVKDQPKEKKASYDLNKAMEEMKTTVPKLKFRYENQWMTKEEIEKRKGEKKDG